MRWHIVSLAEILANAVEASRPFIEWRQHELVLNLRPRGLLVGGDPDRLAQVFSNLLLGSAQYAENGGRITLSLERANDWARIAVQNTGTGVAASDLEDIFETSLQARSHAARAMGLGIDLTLVRTIVQLHGGTVRAFSGGPGLGSTFTVRLPIAAGALAVPEAPVWGEGRTDLRVLVVDHNADAAISLATLLRMLGHEVHTAADGELAVEQVQTFVPDVTFMDLVPPRLDGFDTARRIRASVHGDRVPIVALTGWRQKADRLRMCEAGMEHHLIKPVSLDALQSLLGTLAPACRESGGA